MRRTVAAVIVLLVLFSATLPLRADLGTVLANYHVGASDFVLDPIRPRLYASVPSSNSVMVIDTNTLAVLDTIPVGSSPSGLAVTPDGSHLYVANSGSTAGGISVVDLSTWNVTATLATPVAPWAIEVGLNNRLYLSASDQGSNGLMQIDGNTGSFMGYFDASPGIADYFRTALQISPDQHTLFASDRGLSPASLAKFDISTGVPMALARTPFNSIGSNGEQLVISHNGLFISDVVGGGNSGYDIRLIPPSDLTGSLGSLATGPYPNGLAFSPDDKLAYTNNDNAYIQIYNTATSALLGQFNIPSTGGLIGAPKMIVDSNGDLFISYNDDFNPNNAQFAVLDVTPTPEPTSGILLLGGIAALGLRRRR